MKKIKTLSKTLNIKRCWQITKLFKSKEKCSSKNVLQCAWQRL